MSGDGKRSVAAWPKPPRPSSTLRWTTLPGAPNQIWPSGDRPDASSARIGSGWQHGRKPSAADRPLSLASAGLPLNHPARQPSGDAQSEETEESHHGASYPITRQTFEDEQTSEDEDDTSGQTAPMTTPWGGDSSGDDQQQGWGLSAGPPPLQLPAWIRAQGPHEQHKKHFSCRSLLCPPH